MVIVALMAQGIRRQSFDGQCLRVLALLNGIEGKI